LKERTNHSNKQESISQAFTKEHSSFWGELGVNCGGDMVKQTENAFSQLSIDEAVSNRIIMSTLGEIKIFEFIAKIEKESIKLSNLIMRGKFLLNIPLNFYNLKYFFFFFF
jgi:hypothetical protein